MTDLSEEMKEAIRILREDGQMAAFNKLSESNKELVQRLDEVENNWSEFRATEKEKVPATEPTDSGKSGNPQTDPTPTDNGPQPPPVIESTPEPKKRSRWDWWEKGTYAGS